MGPAEAEAGRRCRLIPVEEMALREDLCVPGGLPPMTGSHQRDKSAEAFWRQLSLNKRLRLVAGNRFIVKHG